jgi:hypothetical protein
MPRKLYGLDETIDLGGKPTTIREQHSARNAHPLRAARGPTISKDPSGHWVSVRRDDTGAYEEFDISEADYKTLAGEA